MARIKIIGTSHIAPESIKKVEKLILAQKPGIVAIELDRKRFLALMHGGKQEYRWRDIKRIGLKGWLFALLGAWVERKLGAKVGVLPGAEMLHAVKTAQQTGAKIALIDQDIELTLSKFSKTITWKEKWRFIADIFKGIFLKKGIEFNLATVPPKKLIQKLLKDVEERYPNVHKVLVEERNEFMAKTLAHITHQYPEENIIAVVGAGHEEEIKKLLKKYIKKEPNYNERPK